MIRVVIAIALALVLTACSFGGTPSQSLVKQAIDLQLRQTQAELAQQLYRQPVEPSEFKITRIDIAKQERLDIEGLAGYRISGTYDLTQTFPTRKVSKRQNPFEVYLQRQVEGKTWRLARLQQNGNESRWVTQLVGSRLN